VKPEIVKKATDFVRTFNGAKVVGVHVRREYRVKWDSRFEVSKYSYYDRLIKIALEREAVVFVATDSEEVIRRFTAEFGNKIRYYPKTDYYRMDLVGMEQALIELLILSWCDMILGCNGSHFSLLPALWGNKPFITVTKRTAGSARGFMDDLFAGKQPECVLVPPHMPMDEE